MICTSETNATPDFLSIPKVRTKSVTFSDKFSDISLDASYVPDPSLCLNDSFGAEGVIPYRQLMEKKVIDVLISGGPYNNSRILCYCFKS